MRRDHADVRFGRRIGDDGAVLGRPPRKAAVEHRDIAMTDPATQEPKARREHVAARIVGDDLRAVIYADRAQIGRELLGIGKRMAAVRAAWRAAHMAVEIGVERAGQMRLAILRATEFGVAADRCVATIDEDPVRIAKMRFEFAALDDGRGHGALPLVRDRRPRTRVLGRGSFDGLGAREESVSDREADERHDRWREADRVCIERENLRCDKGRDDEGNVAERIVHA